MPEHSEKLKEALVGYVPVFGNSTDIYITERLKRLNKLLKEVDIRVLRKPTKEERQTAKMREILAIEEQLVRSITSQKMDF